MRDEPAGRRKGREGEGIRSLQRAIGIVDRMQAKKFSREKKYALQKRA